MGKNKLRKFAEMETMDCVFQFPFSALSGGCPLRGKWQSECFHNNRPIVLELGCGKGEYAVGLGRRFPEKNFIGIDIKGSRMWTGAKQVEAERLTNVAFLRTSIELIDRLFAPGEVSEIWITFPDPQMKKVNKRLTSTRFLESYRRVLQPGGTVHLKTDSPFLYTYTHELVRTNGLPVEVDTDDLYASGLADDILEIKTYYEQQWLSRGFTIKYIKFHLPHETPLKEPDIDIEPDSYRSYNRGQRMTTTATTENPNADSSTDRN
ncbi:MAG: tRNA (guanosine(46)-N7)-methyltransferase TrmB [Muribaculaceae bacterium]|nr:tRNA (guanosine(46)-N7)-methyltransferase TrmB [Muribaculaceae bacterium]